MSEQAPEPQAPAAPESGPYRGPTGETRKLWKVIVLWLITLGFYGWYWMYKQHKEIQDYGGVGVGGPVGLVFAILLPIVNYFLLPSEFGQLQSRIDKVPNERSGWTGLWVVIPVLGFFIWLVKMQGSLNRYWESKGVAPA